MDLAGLKFRYDGKDKVLFIDIETGKVVFVQKLIGGVVSEFNLLELLGTV